MIGKRDEKPIVLAIPSGGVPVGYCLSKRLEASMDIILVRKIPIPGNPEAGFGAVALDGTIVLNTILVQELGLTQKIISLLAEDRLKEIRIREEKFRAGRAPPDLRGREIILVDDGLASGYTMLAAIISVKKQNPKHVMVAVPTAHDEALNLVSTYVNEVYCLNVRTGPFYAVADAYKRWYDLNDGEIMMYLTEVWGRECQNVSNIKGKS
ncbi:phosphoribosyltransferase [Candidatus Bathyarchaeota archaeon]|nr:phosphoribosyltransferase [Candidatus Bathyarchaeota archaeon]MBS7629416.1 phosphoribosyltransferase [Candidatus Bathyarchaeota archaeon]